jgi:hypothetical protein
MLSQSPLMTTNYNENATRTSGKNESSVNLEVLMLFSAKGGLHSGRPRWMMRCASAPTPGFIFFGAMVVRCGTDSIVFRTRLRVAGSLRVDPTVDLACK